MNYTVKTFKFWGDDKDIASVTFDEANNEPIDFRTSKEYKEGDTVEGEVKPYQTKEGKERLAFVPKGQPETQDRILHTWSVGKAIDTAQDNTSPDELYALAEMYQQVVRRFE